jgi:hypothetical protein
LDTADEDDLMDLTFGRNAAEDEEEWIKQLNGINKVKTMVGKAITKGLNKLRRNGQRIGSGAIILDTGSKVSIFSNKDLFGRIMDSDRPIIIDGINSNADGLLVTEEGMTEFGIVYYDCRASANILSYGSAVDSYDRVQYDTDEDAFIIRVSPFQPVYVFRRDFATGMYIYRMDEAMDAVFNIPDGAASLAVTVEDRMEKYSRREVARAEEARELQRKFFFLSDGSLEDLLRRSKIKNTRVTARDIAIAKDIWGPSLGVLKGKSTSSKGKPIIRGERIRTVQQKQQMLHVDLMFVNTIPYLISIMDPIEYVQVTRLKGKDDWTIWRALEYHMRFGERFGLSISLVRVDDESAISSDFFQSKLGEKLDIGGAGTAVPVVERKIRTMKERIRSVINTLPYELTEKMEEYLVRGAAYSINLVPTRNSVEYASPREKLLGEMIDASLDLKHAYGDYVQIHHEDIDNTMAARTEGALAMTPTGALDGSWYYYTLRSNKIVRRRRATALPMPMEVIDHVRSQAAKRKRRKIDNVIKLATWNVSDSDNSQAQPIIPAEEFILPEDQQLGADLDGLWREEDILDDLNDDEDNNSVRSAPMNEQERQQLLNDIFGEDSDDENDLDEQNELHGIAGEQDIPGEQQPPEAPAERLYGRGHRASVPNRYYSRMATAERMTRINDRIESVYGMKLSVNKGIELFGFEAILSIVKEVKQMLDQEVWVGQEPEELTSEDWKTVISSMIFLKEKFTAEGLFQKLKARLVAGGHQQKKELFEEKSAPTIATQSVFMVAAIAAVEGRAVAAVDVPGAFLKAAVSDNDPPVWMKLDRFLTAILVKLDSSYSKFVRKDGTCIVKLRKTLYGTIQAAKAWYDKLAADLEGLGYTRNPCDMCCFNRIEPDGKQSTIIAHVDDLMITASEEAVVDRIIAELDKLYSGPDGQITIQRGRKLEYVGMVFVFNEDKTVSVTMDGYVVDLLEGLSDIMGEADTPATKNLFRVRDDSRKLGDEEKEFYHSTIAKILYLGKRVRPDLLVAISFLVRRVQNPDEDDWSKMVRLVQYIRKTKDYGIKLSGEVSLSVTAFIDASYAVHWDLKSHTGAIITLGKGPVYAKSGIQRLNTTSSAESELVALSDSTGQILWTRQFLEYQGYKVGPATIYEDNQSAIKLAENGRSNSSRTRHIAIRYFFISDRITSGEIKVEYLNTADMIADILTKPLQGALFRRLRSLLLNWDTSCQEDSTMDDDSD